ncbi:MAG: DUF1702 family protein [Bacteroidota bacterium]
MSRSVAANMAYVQQLFQQTQQFMATQPALEELLAHLETEPAQFRSIAFESASVSLARLGMSQWENFFISEGYKHLFHVDIGLGWAYAQTGAFFRIPSGPYRSLRHRMLCDGMGYYFALYRGRKTIKSQQYPTELDPHHHTGFDQGVGRRLWYTAQGEPERLRQLLFPFSTSRHPDLWRGVGIACGYVGGTDEELLPKLLPLAGSHLPQLKTGIALACLSRYFSDSVSQEIRSVCESICKMTFREICQLVPSKLNAASADALLELSDWIPQFDTFFA